MPGGTRSFHFSTGGGGPNGFHFSNADDIWSEFMRSSGVGGGGGGDDDFFGGGGGGFGMPGMPGGKSGRGGRFAGGRRAPEPEVTVVEKTLAVSLEELFNGATKKLKINWEAEHAGPDSRGADQEGVKSGEQDQILRRGRSGRRRHAGLAFHRFGGECFCSISEPLVDARQY
jgi:DnaJ-class molecular chaperone